MAETTAQDWRCAECGAMQSDHTPDYSRPAGSREWRGCPHFHADSFDLPWPGPLTADCHTGPGLAVAPLTEREDSR